MTLPFPDAPIPWGDLRTGQPTPVFLEYIRQIGSMTVTNPFWSTVLLTTNANDAQAALGIRQVMTGTTTYFVSNAGSDVNNGKTVGSPFLTIQHALDVVAFLDNAKYVTIQCATGTYAPATVSYAFLGGVPTLQGDPTTPSNCVISGGTSTCLTVSGSGSRLNVLGFKLTNAGGPNTSDGLYALDGGSIVVTGNMNYGSITGGHMVAENFASIKVLAGYTVSGGGLLHWGALTEGIIDVSGRAITLSGTPAFTIFTVGTLVGMLRVGANAYTGTATGQQFLIIGNSVLSLLGGSPASLPGSSPGGVGSGGQIL